MGAVGLWASRDYRAWFASDTASVVGASLQTLAVSLVAYAVSGSVVAAGWVSTVMLVTQQLAAVAGGALVDRHDRRRLMVMNALVGAVLWGVAAVLLATGSLTLLSLGVVCIAFALAKGLLGGSTGAELRSIIDIRDYPRARSMAEGRDATATMAGSPLGGALYAICPWAPFAISAVLFCVSGLSALRLHPTADASRPTHASPLARDIADGWRWAAGRRVLPLIIAVASLLNLGVNVALYGIQLELVATGTDPTLIGLVDTGQCACLLLGSVVAGRASARLHVGRVVCVSTALVALCVAPLALLDGFPATLAFASLMGLPTPFMNALGLGFVYAKTPEGLQGRAASAVTVSAQALSMFAPAVAGGLLAAVGFHALAGVAASIVACALVVAVTSAGLRGIPEPGGWGGVEL